MTLNSILREFSYILANKLAFTHFPTKPALNPEPGTRNPEPLIPVKTNPPEIADPPN